MKVNWKKPQTVAKKLLEELDIQEPPVPVQKIARHLGADVRYERTERNISGFISRQDDGAIIIGINTFHHVNRQRFTLAHEIGHLCLHTRKSMYVDHIPKFRDVKSSQAVDSDEIEANLFAAALIMPENALRRDFEGIQDDVEPHEAIKRLAARYQVSPEAMRARLERIERISFDC